MKGLDNAINRINRLALPAHKTRIDPRVRLVVALFFIVSVLTVPLYQPEPLFWLFIFPILTAEASGLGFAKVLQTSLWVLLLLLPIVAFNPYYNRDVAFVVAGHAVSWGWISAVTVMLRGLLTVQALIIVAETCGFYSIYVALRGLGCPKVLVTQLAMLYRYISVLLQESQSMHRALLARGFGKRHYSITLWGRFTGQLLLRSVARARRLSAAMAARGFTGKFEGLHTVEGQPNVISWWYLAGWCVVIAFLRFVDVGKILAERFLQL